MKAYRMVALLVCLSLAACSAFGGQGGRLEPTATQPPAGELPQTGAETPPPSVQAQAAALAPGASQAVWLPGGGLAVAQEDSVALVQPAPAGPGLRPQAVPSQALAQGAEMAQAPSLLAAAQQQPVLAWVSGQQSVVVWDQTSGQPQPPVQAPRPVTGLAVSPDGGKVAYITTAGTLVIEPASATDAGAQAAPATFQAPTWLTNLSFSPDGKQIGGTDPASFTVYILDAGSGETVRSLDWTTAPTPSLYGAFFAPNWQRIAWVAQGVVQVMDAATGQPQALLSHADAVTALAWSPDAARLAPASAVNSGGALSPAVLIWDPGGTLLQTIPLASAAQSLSYASDGKLAVLDSTGTLQVFP